MAKASGMDLATAYEAIKISSGTSFVHETESQVILNGSRDISFTMDLVAKDIGLFQEVADRADVALELSPLLISISRMELKNMARASCHRILSNAWKNAQVCRSAPGFPAEMEDDEPEEPGYEIKVASA